MKYSGMVRSLVSIFVLASIGLAPALEAWHPEWGPTPPVAPYSLNALPNQKVVVPMIFPVLGGARFNNGFGASRGKFRHTGIDIKARKMTPVVAPFSGTLGMKAMSFWIYGDNGWMMLGTHLNDDNMGTRDGKGNRDLMFAADVHPGQHVIAGQFIGYVGESGDATAPHLHFEIYAPGKGSTMSRVRNPFYSLKFAQILKKPRVALPDKNERPSKGELRLDGCIRKVDEASGTLIMRVAAMQFSTGQSKAVTSILYKHIKLTPDQLFSAGGWSSIRSFAPYQTVSVYVPDDIQAPVHSARVFAVRSP
jgi:hypothetical protein